MWLYKVSNPGPLALESDALPTVLCSPSLGILSVNGRYDMTAFYTEEHPNEDVVYKLTFSLVY